MTERVKDEDQHKGAKALNTREQKHSTQGSKSTQHKGAKALNTREQKHSTQGSKSTQHKGAKALNTREQKHSTISSNFIPPKHATVGLLCLLVKKSGRKVIWIHIACFLYSIDWCILIFVCIYYHGKEFCPIPLGSDDLKHNFDQG